LLVPFVRYAFKCALLGRLAFSFGLRDISLSHWNAFVLNGSSGWTAGAVILLEAFQPSLFVFLCHMPLPLFTAA